MKFYHFTRRIYFDEYLVDTTVSSICLDAEIPADSEKVMTAEEYWQNSWYPVSSDTSYNRKRIKFFWHCGYDTNDYGEYPVEKMRRIYWRVKAPVVDDINEVKITYQYEECAAPSFQKVMEFPADKVVAYLKENGITYCPMVK